MSDVKNTIVNGKAVLGIEFGSTRIKAVRGDTVNYTCMEEFENESYNDRIYLSRRHGNVGWCRDFCCS